MLLPLAQSTTLRWPVLMLLAGSSLGFILTTKPRTYGNKWMWLGLSTILVVTISNGSSWVNILLIPIYALVMLAGLQHRNEHGYKIFSLLVVIQFVGTVVMVLIDSNVGNGGFIDPANYNLATGITLIGFLLSYDRYKWFILPFAIIAVYLTSAEEAIILVSILIATILIRHDWSKKILLTLGAIIVCGVLFFGFQQPKYLYMISSNQLATLTGQEMPYQTDLVPDITRGRVEGYTLAVTTPSILGHGFNVSWNTHDTIHNVPLRVFYDLGFIGLVGFLLCLIVWCKSTNKYLMVMILAMMLFDHYLWTQAGVWLWSLFGLGYKLPNTYIFKGELT